MKTPLATLAALGLALSATSAQAESVNVTYKDLNLDTAAGQKILERRIDAAAREACGFQRQRTGTRVRSPGSRECYEAAKISASEQIAARIKGESLGG